jgi:hypothetical protein
MFSTKIVVLLSWIAVLAQSSSDLLAYSSNHSPDYSTTPTSIMGVNNQQDLPFSANENSGNEITSDKNQQHFIPTGRVNGDPSVSDYQMYPSPPPSKRDETVLDRDRGTNKIGKFFFSYFHQVQIQDP